jgi:hypothetical protein
VCSGARARRYCDAPVLTFETYSPSRRTTAHPRTSTLRAPVPGALL